MVALAVGALAFVRLMVGAVVNVGGRVGFGEDFLEGGQYLHLELD